MSQEREDRVQALLAKAQAGDKRARDELVKLHMPLVVAQAAKYGRPSIVEDLIQAGVVGPHDLRKGPGGLMLAIERFDPGQKVKFVTFATWWIRAAMESEVGLHGSIVQPHRRGREKRRKVRKVAARLEAGLGREPTAPEVIEAMSPAQRRSVKRRGVELALMPLPRQQLELPGPGNHAEAGHDSPDRLASNTPQPDQALELRRLIRKLDHVLEDSLSPQELLIIREHYGMRRGRQRGEETTLAALSERLGVPRSTLKESHLRALAKLRVMIESTPNIAAAVLAVFGAFAALGSRS